MVMNYEVKGSRGFLVLNSLQDHKLKRRNFWSLEAKETDSWIWKTLLSLRPLASQMLSCRVGDGRRISFWYDNWSIHGPLIRFIGLNGPLLMGIQDQSTVSEALLVRDWQAPSRTRNQNVSLVRATLRDWPHQAVPSEPDIFMWGPSDSSSGSFSTKTWEFLRPRAETKEWSQVVWFKNMVPKHAFNFWVANLNRLPLNERLHQWGLMDSGLCTLCSTDQESRDHMFLKCMFAADVWDRVKQKLGSPGIRITSWNDLIEWLLSRTGSARRRYLRKIVCQTAVYLIWKERNDRKHGRLPSTSIVIFNKIDRRTKDTLLARRHNKGCGNLLSLWFSYS